MSAQFARVFAPVAQNSSGAFWTGIRRTAYHITTLGWFYRGRSIPNSLEMRPLCFIIDAFLAMYSAFGFRELPIPKERLFNSCCFITTIRRRPPSRASLRRMIVKTCDKSWHHDISARSCTISTLSKLPRRRASSYDQPVKWAYHDFIRNCSPYRYATDLPEADSQYVRPDAAITRSSYRYPSPGCHNRGALLSVIRPCPLRRRRQYCPVPCSFRCIFTVGPTRQLSKARRDRS